MLVFKFIVLASIFAGSYCMSVECMRQSQLECIEYVKGVPEVLRTVEDVIEYCTNFLPLGHCVLGVMEKCAKNENFWDNDEDVEKLREMLKFIESSCDEDSQIFKAITDNLHCVVTTFYTMDDICYWKVVNQTVKERIEELVVEEPQGCVIDAWKFHCMTARYDVECGNEARDAVSEILDNIDYLSPYCRGVIQGLSYFESAFKSQFRSGKKGESVVNAVFEVIRQQEA